MNAQDPITIAILAGGQSTRMKQDKATIQFRGRPLIHRILDTATSITNHILIVSSLEVHQALGYPCVPDRYPGNGPLGGLHAALEAATTPRVLLLGCDLPFLTSEMLTYLIHYPTHAWAAVAFNEGKVEPLCGIYRKEALPLLEQRLVNQQLRMQEALEALQAERVNFDIFVSKYPHAFANLNTPEALQYFEDINPS